MEKFIIEYKKTFIDGFYRLEYSHNGIYKDKASTYKHTTDPASIDEELIRVDLFNILSEIYKTEFTSNFYL
jgi:hypothetical protein